MGDGNCLVIATKNVLKNKDWLFCYAKVKGQGKLSGKRIVHAWNEHRGIVYDFSNGKNIVMNKEVYYAIAQISEKDVIKQTSAEVKKLDKAHKYAGGWILLEDDA